MSQRGAVPPACPGTRPQVPASMYRTLFEEHPVATVAFDSVGRILAFNDAARELIGEGIERQSLRCCTLLGCHCRGFALSDGCITELTLAAGRPLERDPVALTAGAGGSVSVRAVPLRGGGGVVVELHAYDGPTRAATLTIAALGRTRVERDGRSLGGEWLQHRPGQVLKYLVAARGRPVPVEEIVEALWPATGPSAIPSLRQAIHTLRDHLESGRPRHAASRYIIGGKGHYELNLDAIEVDADRFEEMATRGLQAHRQGDRQRAADQLAIAAAAYTGPFLADDPYADWALSERDRLHALAGQALRALAELRIEAGDIYTAWPVLNRLGDLEPFDIGIQRQLLAVLIARGRRSEAARRCDAIRRRYERAFGEPPDLSLAEVGAIARDLVRRGGR